MQVQRLAGYPASQAKKEGALLPLPLFQIILNLAVYP